MISWKQTFIASGLFCLLLATTNGAMLTLSGFNQDLIGEVAAAGPIAGTSTDFSGWVFNEQGIPGGAPATRGFPSTGLVTTTTASLTAGSTFQLSPYTGNNALRVGLTDLPMDRQLTLSLGQQSTYQNLQFLTVTQGSSPGTSWSAILVFDDASTSTYSVASNRPDWTSAPANSSTLRYNHNGVERRDANWGVGSGEMANSTSGIYLYEDSITLAPADQLKTLVGVRFDVTSTAGTGVAVFAIDGTAIPEPSAALLAGFGLAGLCSRRRRSPGR